MFNKFIHTFFIVLLIASADAQIIYEDFKAHNNITSNWTNGLEKLNDSTYLFLENTITTQAGTGLQVTNRLYKINKNWERTDSINFSLTNIFLSWIAVLSILLVDQLEVLPGRWPYLYLIQAWGL